MYSQQEALGQLLDYSALDSDQQKAQEFIVEFVRANPDYWSRANLAGHLTGSVKLFKTFRLFIRFLRHMHL